MEAIVRIGNDANVLSNPACPKAVSATQISANQQIKVICPLTGRYISVNLPGSGKILTLCEVKVFAFEEPGIEYI